MAKILVVDDEKDVCEFVNSFFRDRGFEVCYATNGEEAISAVIEKKPDIALLDIKMEGMDGIAVLRQMKKIEPHIIVIMVTAVDDIKKMEEAKLLGAADYITKPLVLEELEKKVMTLTLEKI